MKIRSTAFFFACFIIGGVLILQSCTTRRCTGIKAHPDYHINGARNW